MEADEDPADPRAADEETLTDKVGWLRTQADRVAANQPLLHGVMAAALRHAGPATAHEMHALAESSSDGITEARQTIERLAADLEAVTSARAHGDEFAAGTLFHRGARRHALASDDATSRDQIVALVDDVADELPGDAGERCRIRLRRATDSELSLLTDLVQTGLTHDQLLRLLEGGHLLLPGHGLLKRWKKLPGVQPRTSSHYHPDDRRRGRSPHWVERARARVGDAHANPRYGQQFGLRGRFVHEALFGPGPHHTTFVQLERAAPSKVHLPRHVADWIRYRLTRRNQGPYGSSTTTDARPMRAIVWWKPTKRSDDARRLQESVAESDRIVATLLEVGNGLDAQGRLGALVWRGPASTDFDAAVGDAIGAVNRAAAAVHTLGVRIRREERTV